MATTAAATLEELRRVPGKAELVGGAIQRMAPVGDEPNTAAFVIAVSLREHSRVTGVGRAYTDNAGFVVNLPHRRSFSPDASYYLGPRSGMRFLDGAPVFAAEVRSEGDYGPTAEAAKLQKRADYFAAGTLVVWDVDLLSDDVVRVYRAGDPHTPTVYRRPEVAEAEPAVPGWRLPVDDLFE